MDTKLDAATLDLSQVNDRLRATETRVATVRGDLKNMVTSHVNPFTAPCNESIGEDMSRLDFLERMHRVAGVGSHTHD